MNFLQFAVWGSYLTSMGSYLADVGMASHIGMFYAMQGIVSIFMPAVIGIIAMVDVPICFMVTRLIPSGVHPVVLREGGMSGDMGMTVAVCLAGLMLVGFALYRFRFRQVRLQERLQALKDEVEVLEERR